MVPNRSRKVGLAVFLLLVFGGLAVRLVQVQAVAHAHYVSLAEGQSESVEKIPAPRGEILDRNGVVLAHSVPAFDLWCYTPELDDAKELARMLERLVQVRERKTLDALSRGRYVRLAEALSPPDAERVRSLEIRSLRFEATWRRAYPQGRAFSHVIGVCGAEGEGEGEGEGLEGLELAFDEVLRGRDGKRKLVKDARGRRLEEETIEPPRPGATLRLALDARLQEVVRHELSRAAERHLPEAAVAGVMDVRTGDLLAAVSLPDYDPSDLSRASRDSLRFRFLTDCFEPGSTFKTFVVAAALDEGLVSQKSAFFCERGRWNYGGRVLHDCGEFGWLTVTDILVKSSNVGAAKIGTLLGKERLWRHVAAFGFGRKTGAGFPGESAGILRDPDEWSGYSVASISIGQEMAATPLQLLAAYGAVANGGVLMKPRAVLEIRGAEGQGKGRIPPTAVRRALRAESSRLVRGMLLKAVENGTGRLARSDAFHIAGKTGTAQKAEGSPPRYSQGAYFASFCAFAPAERPVLACVVALDRPGRGRYGGKVAAPAAAAMLKRSLELLGAGRPVSTACTDR